MMKTILNIIGAVLLLVLLICSAASAQKRRDPGPGEKTRHNGFAPEQAPQKPTLIIRGKGGKITDVERQGVMPREGGGDEAAKPRPPTRDDE